MLLTAAVMACGWAPAVEATNLHWNTTTGDWSTASNWAEGVAPRTTDPYPSNIYDIIYITNGGTAQITSGNAYSSYLHLGDAASGALQISGGAHFQNDGTSYIGYRTAAGNGSVTVTGAGSQWTANGDLIMGSTGSGSLTVSNGARLEQIQYRYPWRSIIGQDSSASVIIDGSGSTWNSASSTTIGNAGSGTVTLSNGGTATFIGGTGTVTIASQAGSTGTLNIGAASGQTAAGAGTLNAASVNFGSGTGTVVFNHTDSAYTFAPNITGAGSVQVEAGTTILTGTNTYSGGTTVSGGILRGDSNGLQGNITNNASVEFNQGPSGTYAGDMSGSGSLTKIGTGRLILSGNNTYSGGTTVSGGTLLGNSTSLQGSITNNASVVFMQNADGAYSGSISGSGSLVKIGAGTLTVSGNNTYTGATTVDDGILSVNGSITSATTVYLDGTLGGTGTVGSVTLRSGAIAPGNAIGTLTASSVDFSSAGVYGVYQVEVDAAGNSDLLNVTGTATLTGGSVQVLPEAGNYHYSTDYTILTAGTINGTFNSVSSNLAFLDPTLSYDANNVYLNLTRNDTAYGAVAGTSNQRAVANALTTIVMSGGGSADMQNLTNTFNTLTAAGAQQAYDSLSGVQHATAQSLLLGHSKHFSNLIGQRTNMLAAYHNAKSSSSRSGNAEPQARAFTPIQLAYNGDLANLQLASNGPTTGLMETMDSRYTYGFWLIPQAGSSNIKDTANASGADYSWYGLYGGSDTWLDDNRLVGFGLGLSQSEAAPKDGTINTNSVELNLYGRWQDEQRYLDADLYAGYHLSDSTRHITVGTLSRTAQADYNANSLGAALETGQRLFEMNRWHVIPFAGLRYTRLNREGFSETGAGSENLVVDSNAQDSLQGRLGLRTMQHSELGERSDWVVSMAWVHEFGDTTSTLNARFDGAPGTTFDIDGPELDRNRLQLGVGLIHDISPGTTVRFGYDGELAPSDSSHTISANFRTGW